jgi:hypothetical protein
MIKSLAAPGIYRIVRLEQHQQFLVSAQKTIAEIEVTGTPVKTATSTGWRNGVWSSATASTVVPSAIRSIST